MKGAPDDTLDDIIAQLNAAPCMVETPRPPNPVRWIVVGGLLIWAAVAVFGGSPEREVVPVSRCVPPPAEQLVQRDAGTVRAVTAKRENAGKGKR
jgi:hypothetical protein